MEQILDTSATGFALCPRCRRKFDFNEIECPNGCTTAIFPGGPRLPMRLWRRVPRADGTTQILTPESVPLKKRRPGVMRWDNDVA